MEAAIIDPRSAEIRDEHLLCAAHEAPLTEEDASLFGDDVLDRAGELAQLGLLRERASGFVLRRADDYPAARVALRSASADSFALIDADEGELLGTIEAGRAYSTVHDGAVYLHLGRSYLVRELDLKKPPSIAESIDWARALLLLGARDIDSATFAETMSVIVKHRADLDTVAARVGVQLTQSDATRPAA